MKAKRKHLVCVTGLSPQIVTETIHALAQRQWIPDEVSLITTAEGANRARLSLLSEEPGWFKRLLHDHQLPPILFDESHILVLKDAKGAELPDIRSPEDNEMAANLILDHIRRLTADPGKELHVSIAGGRKTMGFYLGYALTLFGRPQDRLSHVLVSEPFESCWDFFYPTPYSRIIQTRDQNLADTKDARVTLGEIPFVSLRHGMTDAVLNGDISYAQAVEAARQALAPPSLTIDLEQRCIQAAGQQLSLAPAQLAMLSLFARRRLAGKAPLPAPFKQVPDQDWARRFLREYDQIKGDFADSTKTRQALKSGMDGDYFSQTLSKLKKTLHKTLGKAATPYLIEDGDCRPRQYSLSLKPEAISYGKLARAAKAN